MLSISNQASFLSFNVKSSFSSSNKEITIESLQDELDEYNKNNHDDVLFIDILEKISFNMSSQDKMAISKDGRKLLEKIDDELSKMNGNQVFSELSSPQQPNENILREISKLKSELSKESDESKSILLVNKIMELETRLLNSFDISI
jgi:hypothetical protein